MGGATISPRPSHTGLTPPTWGLAGATAMRSTAKGFAIADSGATGHYIAEGDVHCLVDVVPATLPLTVCLPDGSTHYGGAL